jgi:hypothetical protein
MLWLCASIIGGEDVKARFLFFGQAGETTGFRRGDRERSSKEVFEINCVADVARC